ncbi:MAG: hypothetical protein ACJAT1_000374 [Marivirga sp.]|jgi:hypothetical protein
MTIVKLQTYVTDSIVLFFKVLIDRGRLVAIGYINQEDTFLMDCPSWDNRINTICKNINLDVV